MQGIVKNGCSNQRELGSIKRGVTPLLNTNTGKPYTQWVIWDNWKRLSGTEVTAYEATRHSFCSQISSKVNSRIGQRLMRHKSKESTDHYCHEWSENLVDAVQTIDNVIKIKKADDGK